MTNPFPKQKIHCFVDETGQETEGRFFLVSVVITDQELDPMIEVLHKIEQSSKKRLGKWHKTKFEIRVAYIEDILTNPLFAEVVFFSHHAGSQDYFDLTIQTTAEAIRFKTLSENYTATITVDGLKGEEINKFKRRLKNLNISVRKVRGARDESDPLIRMADAFAGFIRDYIEGQEYAKDLYERAVRARILREI